MPSSEQQRLSPDPAEVKAIFGEILDAQELGNEQDAERILRKVTPEVRRAVDALLHAHSRASGVLLDDTPVPTRQEPQHTNASQPAPTIAGYDIAEEIGRGGFGIVYSARQRTPIDRPVAIKVLRRELVSDDAINRFRSESTLLARMSHEAIARVYDAGLTDQGQPFVAMELIDARPLNIACESLHLNTRQRVELIAQVCDAIQHAHQRAVIHRDLKPGNILIEQRDSSYHPRVIDFGIAKLLDNDPNSPNTSIHVRLGTPRYMSPEQRTGSDSSDTRVDVYALGAILCELLAGDVPTASTKDSSERESSITRPSKIASEQPDRTSAHPKALRGDLDRIVLKACADDPDLRYPSAQAMGEDLRRYLNGLPVNASPPSIVYVARKFVRRHRASVSLAGVLGIALIVTLGVAALKWREASQQRDRAQANAQRVAFIGDFLLEMLLLSADTNARGAPPILTKEAMQDIANRAIEGMPDDPERMLTMLVGIGQFQTRSGYPETGTQTMRTALGFAIEHHGIPSPEVIKLRVQLHDALWGHGLEGWKEQIQLADSESAQLYPDDDPNRMRVLQRAVQSIDNLKTISAAYEALPNIDPADQYQALFALTMLQRFSQTPEDQLESSRRLYEVAIANYPTHHTAVIDSMALYGDAMSSYAPTEETLRVLETAYERSISVLGFDHFTTESIRRGLARTHGILGHPERGIPYALADLESVERARGTNTIQYANGLLELGRLYQYDEQFQEARDAFERSLSLKLTQWSQGHPQITTVQVLLAQVAHAQGDHERADELAIDALEHLTQQRDASTFASAMRVRISIKLQAGDESGASELQTQARAHLSDIGHDEESIESMIEVD